MATALPPSTSLAAPSSGSSPASNSSAPSTDSPSSSTSVAPTLPPPPTSASSSDSSTTLSPPPTTSASSGTSSSSPTSDTSSSASISLSNSSSSNSSSSTSSSSSSSSTPTPTTLSQASTSVFSSASLITSDGQTLTTVISVTSIYDSGTVVTPTNPTVSSHSTSDVGAIVGGVVGGIAGLAIVAVIIWALLRKRRIKNEFDGNFDPAYVTSAGRAGGGGGTLPQMNVDEDDGMGGRLESGVEGGGIISPYSYNPGNNMTQVQSPSMSSHGGAVPLMAGAAAGVAAGTYFAGNQNHGQEQGQYLQYNNTGPSSSGSYYPGSTSHEGNPPVTPSDASYAQTNTTSSSGQGQGFYPATVNPYAPPIGRGPSPGPSALDSSEHSSAGIGPYGAAAAGAAGGAAAAGVYNPRSAKELEAMGRRHGPHVVNPDDPGAARQGQNQQLYGDHARQAYLQYGPGGVPTNAHSPPPGQQYYGHAGQPSVSSSEGGAIPASLRPGSVASTGSASGSRPDGVRAGSAVIVHQDGGRVVMRKGEAVEEEEEPLSEIPPTYDSLPHARPGEGEQSEERQ